jgi:hypothetical protein
MYSNQHKLFQAEHGLSLVPGEVEVSPVLVVQVDSPMKEEEHTVLRRVGVRNLQLCRRTNNIIF